MKFEAEECQAQCQDDYIDEAFEDSTVIVLKMFWAVFNLFCASVSPARECGNPLALHWLSKGPTQVNSRVKQVGIGLAAVMALEFIGLESSSIALAFPRSILVATISVVGYGIQICTRMYM